MISKITFENFALPNIQKINTFKNRHRKFRQLTFEKWKERSNHWITVVAIKCDNNNDCIITTAERRLSVEEKKTKHTYLGMLVGVVRHLKNFGEKYETAA